MIRCAEARLAASIMTISSISASLTLALLSLPQIDWTMNMSAPRIESL